MHGCLASPASQWHLGNAQQGSIKCETQRLIGKSRQHRPLYHLQQAHSQRFKKGHKRADPYRPY